MHPLIRHAKIVSIASGHIMLEFPMGHGLFFPDVIRATCVLLGVTRAVGHYKVSNAMGRKGT